MKAMLLQETGQPLELVHLPIPRPKEGDLLLRVKCCGVCRTDLHLFLGELKPPSLPLILGHQIVGEVIEIGENVKKTKVGDRVGVSWLAKSCHRCNYCLSGKENLCDKAQFTGFHTPGGFAEFCVIREHYSFALPPDYANEEIAPLLCGGFIGYRALRMTLNAKKIGFYGFGSSAHLLTQLAKTQKREIYAFVRKGDEKAKQFALELGAVWAGDSESAPPHPLDAAILFAPNGDLVPLALKAVKKAGVVVCAGIHMSDLPSFPYTLLWEERVLRSVANMTRRDGEEFLSLAKKRKIQAKVTLYPLEEANRALEDIREGKLIGSAVLQLL